MAQETITVMVCDRCGERLELRGDKGGEEYSRNLSLAAKWHTVRWSDMGGDHSYLLNPPCWVEVTLPGTDEVAGEVRWHGDGYWAYFPRGES